MPLHTALPRLPIVFRTVSSTNGVAMSVIRRTLLLLSPFVTSLCHIRLNNIASNNILATKSW